MREQSLQDQFCSDPKKAESPFRRNYGLCGFCESETPKGVKSGSFCTGANCTHLRVYTALLPSLAHHSLTTTQRNPVRTRTERRGDTMRARTRRSQLHSTPSLFSTRLPACGPTSGRKSQNIIMYAKSVTLLCTLATARTNSFGGKRRVAV